MDAHELVSAAKELAVELGRTPTRREFAGKYGGEYAITKLGGYIVLLKMAGLDTPEERRAGRKIDNSVFERDLEDHLRDYKPREFLAAQEPYARTLFIPDTHFPFEHGKTLEKIYRFAEREKPAIVIQIGDLKDRISHGRFPRSHNVFTPDQEEERAHKKATDMWAEIKRAVPGARCIQILGNHDVRPLRQVLTHYPEIERWVQEGLAKSMTFEGVETVMDPRQDLILPGDVAVTHGHLSQLGQHRDEYLMNVVHGHRHVGGVVFRQIRGRVLWELDCGLAGDPESKGLSYTPTKTVKWTLGWGFLDEYGPRFCHA